MYLLIFPFAQRLMICLHSKMKLTWNSSSSSISVSKGANIDRSKNKSQRSLLQFFFHSRLQIFPPPPPQFCCAVHLYLKNPPVRLLQPCRCRIFQTGVWLKVLGDWDRRQSDVKNHNQNTFYGRAKSLYVNCKMNV